LIVLHTLCIFDTRFKPIANMVLTVYLDPITINCRKVLSGLDLMGIQYETKHVDYFKGEQKAPEFTKINPMATIPAATDGDLVLTESNSILQYAADHAKDESFYPKDLKKRADVNRWLLWEAATWFGVNYTYLVQNVVVPELFKGQPDKKILDDEAPKFETAAKTLDERLAKSKFVCGDNITIADIAVAAPMHMHEFQKSGFEKYPNIQRWIKEVEKIPAWSDRQKAVENALMPSRAS
jgi:glutathione S-transferase